MEYQSTRGGASGLSAAEAILKGLAADKGLFVPDAIPTLSAEDFEFLGDCNYLDAAKLIFELYLDDFSLDEIDECVNGAYLGSFDSAAVAPLVSLDEQTRVLELWHGPTSAFKDMALQALPRLLTTSMKLTGEKREVVILVATSGDTGKAALEGFKDVPGTSIVVLYPSEGVSAVQKQQMVTQEGGNVHVLAIEGNFDDAQSAAKSIFMDQGAAERLSARGKRLSSANSINWGRLLPQIVYYVNTCAKLMADGSLKAGETVDFSVPTGNFGNILACYYAKQMGAPIGRLICASNANNVLTEFLRTGVYDRNRPFHKTLSPSMDILVSSNLERLLFELSGHDAAFVADCMKQLDETGRYEVPTAIHAQLSDLFYADFSDDEETQGCISETWNRHHYLVDTHTAVACRALENYRLATGSRSLAVVASTASPYKFPCGVYAALCGETACAGLSEYEVQRALSQYTSVPIPEPLADLEQKPVLHNRLCTKQAIAAAVESVIG